MLSDCARKVVFRNSPLSRLSPVAAYLGNPQCLHLRARVHVFVTESSGLAKVGAGFTVGACLPRWEM